MNKGISLNFVVSADGTQPTFPLSNVALLQQAGATVARVDLHLGTKTYWDSQIVAAYTNVLNALVGAGISVIGLLGYGIVPGAQQADWNVGAVEAGGLGTNPFIDAYASAVYDLVRLFPQIHLWELWNEPNAYTSQPSPGVYAGGSFLYPSLFVELLNRAQPVIKAQNPSATVITGGLLAQDLTNTSTQSSGASYLDSVYGYGGWTTHTTPFDAVGLHLYLDQAGPLNTQTLMRYLLQCFAVDVTHEGESRWKSVWVTESGWNCTGSIAPALQASNITAMMQVLRAIPYLKTVLNYQLTDTDQYFGLYTANGTPKPALAAFQSA